MLLSAAAAKISSNGAWQAAVLSLSRPSAWSAHGVVASSVTDDCRVLITVLRLRHRRRTARAAGAAGWRLVLAARSLDRLGEPSAALRRAQPAAAACLLSERDVTERLTSRLP